MGYDFTRDQATNKAIIACGALGGTYVRFAFAISPAIPGDNWRVGIVCNVPTPTTETLWSDEAGGGDF